MRMRFVEPGALLQFVFDPAARSLVVQFADQDDVVFANVDWPGCLVACFFLFFFARPKLPAFKRKLSGRG